MKKTGPTNPVLRELIEDLKEKSRQEEVSIWDRVADDLEKPRRQRRTVNVYKINDNSSEGDIVLVPGKVLGEGEIEEGVTVAAFDFSSSAAEKIKDAGGKAMGIREILEQRPEGRNIKLIG